MFYVVLEKKHKVYIGEKSQTPVHTFTLFRRIEWPPNFRRKDDPDKPYYKKEKL